MSSEYHWWGLDTMFTASGDDATVSAIDEINQSIIRECLTAPGEYYWEPTYGLGLGQYVGKALTSDKLAEIKGDITSVVAKQQNVQQQPGATVTFISDTTGLLAAQISYTYTPTGQAVMLKIPPSQ